MNGSSLHFKKKTKEIRHTEIMLSIKLFSRMETRPTRIQSSMFNGHFAPIACEPSLTHIIYQTIIYVDIKIQNSEANNV
jgi:hypothetical protein